MIDNCNQSMRLKKVFDSISPKDKLIAKKPYIPFHIKLPKQPLMVDIARIAVTLFCSVVCKKQATPPPLSSSLIPSSWEPFA